MQTAHELFIHGLGDMLSGERQLVDALQEHEQAASRPELKKAFASHRAQTEKQVERLQQCFEEVGASPKEAECKGIAGLIEEASTFKQEQNPSPDILDVASITGAKKVECYEINAYKSLIDLAKSMKHNGAVKLLSQNLKEEEQTLQKMEQFGKKIKPEQLGMEEEEEAGAAVRTSRAVRAISRTAQSGRSRARRAA